MGEVYQGDEVVINMRIGYVLLILSILLVCLWFTYVSVQSKEYYRRAFRMLMWSGVIMYINHLYGISMEEGVIPCSNGMIIAERMIHYISTVSVYALYAYFMLCLLDQFHYFPMWRKLLFFAPAIIMDLMIISSPLTHLVFYMQDGIVYRGGLFWLLMLVRGSYAVGATIQGLARRRLLPKIFGQCVIVVAVFAVVQFLTFVVLKDETLYYSMLIVNIVLFLLALTVVEFYKDTYTGLLNREAYEQYTKRDIYERSNKAVYLIKLKNYMYLKENCHEVSIIEIIKELAECIKEYSMLTSIYYIGIGRFVVIVHKRDHFSEQDFLDKLKARMEDTFLLNGADIHLYLFVAVINLESSKINRKNYKRYFAACDDMRYNSNEPVEVIQGDSFGIDQLQRYRSIEEAIERALVEKEFRMFYQPIIEASTGRIISAEALIRLNDRVLGFVSPEEFIPISESNGKIHEVSEYVIDTVFRFIKEHNLQNLGVEFIELNLSVMQCMDKKLSQKLEYYLNKYDVDPKHINLEITETATNFDEKRLRTQLQKLKNLGFTFSLDDYGTGYSNLVRVLEYPVDIIKLDKSIVWSAFQNRDSFVTLKNLISMFHDVHRRIVAEGVESEEQRNALRELSCDYLQGYFYSKPVDEDTFISYVQNNQHYPS